MYWYFMHNIQYGYRKHKRVCVHFSLCVRQHSVFIYWFVCNKNKRTWVWLGNNIKCSHSLYFVEAAASCDSCFPCLNMKRERGKKKWTQLHHSYILLLFQLLCIQLYTTCSSFSTSHKPLLLTANSITYYTLHKHA